MPVEVKICGLSNEETLDCAIEAGADYAGFMHYPKSPRHITLDRAKELVSKARAHIKTVIVLVDPGNELIDAVTADVMPDCIQLQGTETPDRVREITTRTEQQILKAIKVFDQNDITRSAHYHLPGVRLLFDAKAPANLAGALPGGNGIAFDWNMLTTVPKLGNYILAGGLDAGNVELALQVSGAQAVDVSSGVEREPGVKDPKLIRGFIAAAKKHH